MLDRGVWPSAEIEVEQFKRVQRRQWISKYRIHRRRCGSCKRLFEDGETCHKVRGMGLYFCEACLKPEGSIDLGDFLPGGSRELETRSWTWMRALCLIRDGYLCRSCFKRSKEVHHIMRRSEGGTDHLHNLVTLCEECHDEHKGKGGLNTTALKIRAGKQLTFKPWTSTVGIAES